MVLLQQQLQAPQPAPQALPAAAADAALVQQLLQELNLQRADHLLQFSRLQEAQRADQRRAVFLTSTHLKLPAFSGFPRGLAAGGAHRASSTADSIAIAVKQWLQHVDLKYRSSWSPLGHGSDAAAEADAEFQEWFVQRVAESFSDDAAEWWLATASAAAPPSTWKQLRAALTGRYLKSVTTVQYLHRLFAFTATAAATCAGNGMRPPDVLRYVTAFGDLVSHIPADARSDPMLVAHLLQGLPEASRTAVHKALQEAERAGRAHPTIDAIRDLVYDKAMTSQGPASAAAPARAISVSALDFADLRAEAGGWLALIHGPDATTVDHREGEPAPGESFTDVNGTAWTPVKPRNGRSGAVPPDVRASVPAALEQGRRTAGLCVKCGKLPYVKGGHSARTCHDLDTRTPVAEGMKKAGLPLN